MYRLGMAEWVRGVRSGPVAAARPPPDRLTLPPCLPPPLAVAMALTPRETRAMISANASAWFKNLGRGSDGIDSSDSSDSSDGSDSEATASEDREDREDREDGGVPEGLQAKAVVNFKAGTFDARGRSSISRDDFRRRLQEKYNATVEETDQLLAIAHVSTSGKTVNCRFGPFETYRGYNNSLAAFREKGESNVAPSNISARRLTTTTPPPRRCSHGQEAGWRDWQGWSPVQESQGFRLQGRDV